MVRSEQSQRPSSRSVACTEERQRSWPCSRAGFMDLAAPQVHATLLDEGRWLCSLRTMYRILDEKARSTNGATNSATPSTRTRAAGDQAQPGLDWDITKLLGPAKWTYFYLYVILDIFSATSWAGPSPTASAPRCHAFIEETCRRHNIDPGQLTLHADRGSP